MSRITTATLALALSLTAALPLAGQGVGKDPPTSTAPTTRVNAAPLVVGGTVGSFAGLLCRHR